MATKRPTVKRQEPPRFVRGMLRTVGKPANSTVIIKTPARKK